MFASRTRPIVLAVLGVIVLLAGLVIMAPSAAQEQPPKFGVGVDSDGVEGFDWPEGAVVTLEIDDPVTAATPDFTASQLVAAGSGGIVPFQFAGEYDVKAGDVVTMYDGEPVFSTSHQVQTVQITGVDVVADTVSGTADAGDEITVHLFPELTPEFTSVVATIDGSGNWTADFAGVHDIVAGDGGGAQEPDPLNSNFTEVYWFAPGEPPLLRQIEAYPGLDAVLGWDAELTLTVERGGIQVYPVGTDPAVGYYGFDLWRDGFDLQPGDRVTVSDGETTKDVLVTDQVITSVDETTGEVCGTASALDGTHMHLQYGYHHEDYDGEALSDPITVNGGQWCATIDEPGYQIRPGSIIEATTFEEPADDNDQTKDVWFWPAPTFTVRPPSFVEGQGWPLGVPVDLSVEGFTVDPSPMPERHGAFPWDTGFGTELFDQSAGQGWEAQPGQVVYATNGESAKDHQVVALTFDELNVEDDYAAGTAPDGTVVQVGVGNEQAGFGLEVVAGAPPPEPGTWFADFGAEGFVVTEDMGGEARVTDIDGDATAVGIAGDGGPGEGDPFILAIKTEGDKSSFVGGRWNPDPQIEIEVLDENGDRALGLGPWTADVDPEAEGGRADYFFDEFPGVLEPGWTVRATGQVTGRVVEILVVDLLVEGTDGGRIFGTTDYEPTADYVGAIRVEVFGPEHANRVATFGPHETEPGLWTWAADFAEGPNPDIGEFGGFDAWGEGVFGQVEQESALPGSTGSTVVHVGDFGGEPAEPKIEADPLNDVIRVYGFDDPGSIGLEIVGGPDVGEPTDEDIPGQDEEAFVFDVYPADLKPDDVITTEAGSRQHVVTPLTITDRVGTVVYGTASPNAVVQVEAGQAEAQGGQGGFQEVQADGTGAWSADFGFDVTHASTGTRTSEPDDDGDATVVKVGEALAGIFVVYELDLVVATDWSGLGPVTVSVGGAEVTVPVTRGADPVSFGGFDFPEPLHWYALAEIPVDVVPGQTVTATDGMFVTEHVVRDLRVLEADKDAETLAGTVDLYGVPSTLIGFIVDEFGGAGVGSAEPAPDGPWTLDLIDAMAGGMVPYDLQHTDAIGIALVTDEVVGVEDGDFTAVLWDMAPHVTSLDLPPEPVEVGTEVGLHATFTDIETPDTHRAEIDWGDGETTTLDGAPKVIDQGHAYTEAGIYSVVLTVTDEGGSKDTATHEFVVVYDPDGGFVTGGGWIDSPAGAYRDGAELTGKVTFGLNAKYGGNATAPTGNTNVQLHAGELHFRSTLYDWLVVVGDLAVYTGEGTVNGDPGYGFTLWVTDDGNDDTFRLRVWDPSGDVVYDNDEGGGAGTPLGGGSIKVHT